MLKNLKWNEKGNGNFNLEIWSLLFVMKMIKIGHFTISIWNIEHDNWIPPHSSWMKRKLLKIDCVSRNILQKKNYIFWLAVKLFIVSCYSLLFRCIEKINGFNEKYFYLGLNTFFCCIVDSFHQNSSVCIRCTMV